jgi:hypothetical protein
MIPRRLRVPALGWVPTDVIEVGRLRPQAFKGRARPASPGVGVGHVGGLAGTLGCVVRRKGNAKDLFILSNSHVLALAGLAAIDDPIYQPAPHGASAEANDLLGHLAAFVPFAFSAEGYPNRVDAAIARVPADRLRREVRLLGARPTRIETDLAVGMAVQKVGMATDLTTSVIDDVNFKYATKFPSPGSGARRRVGFGGLVACAGFTGDGDSGSAVLSKDGALVGLHFAGSGSRSVFQPISAVFTALNLELA